MIDDQGDKFCPSEARDGENNSDNKQHLLKVTK